MKIHDITQKTQEWHELRCGRVGGSECSPLLVKGQNDLGLSAGAMSLLYCKAAEIITGDIDLGFIDAKMERGMDLEPFARRRYEEETFSIVEEIGYVSEGDNIGYSPDGFTNNDGLIEIKCPLGPGFIRYASTRKISTSYQAQVQWGLWVTQAKWCDFIVYHPDFELDLIIKRIEPDLEMHERFKAITPIFIKELNRVVASMKREQKILG